MCIKVWECVCVCGCLNYQSKRVCRTCGTSTFRWSVSRSGQRFLAKACTTLVTSEEFTQVADWELNTEHKYLYGMHVEHKTKGKQMEKKTQNHRRLRRQWVPRTFQRFTFIVLLQKLIVSTFKLHVKYLCNNINRIFIENYITQKNSTRRKKQKNQRQCQCCTTFDWQPNW